ncbi:hypothetical protein RRG08_013054 [Elysia crispata]|uniref:Uncharacterized protein n=1 Tax=Elysia crispata TaxID=231223 RepID=A0AAE1DQP7_9GAST|nr:hypothetical protein RRG08_013054 [Elysia crispata]
MNGTAVIRPGRTWQTSCSVAWVIRDQSTESHGSISHPTSRPNHPTSRPTREPRAESLRLESPRCSSSNVSVNKRCADSATVLTFAGCLGLQG